MYSLNVLCFVLIGDGDIPTTGHQINSAALTELLIIDREGELDDAFNIIVPRRY